jgi:hypothetical protein
VAIFFSLAPFSFFFGGEKAWWMLRDAPKSALVYGIVGVLGWLAYGIERSTSTLTMPSRKFGETRGCPAQA